MFKGMFLQGLLLTGGFKYFLCSPLLGEMIPILTNIFQMGWFNHQPDCVSSQFHPIRGCSWSTSAWSVFWSKDFSLEELVDLGPGTKRFINAFVSLFLCFFFVCLFACSCLVWEGELELDHKHAKRACLCRDHKSWEERARSPESYKTL